MTSFAVNSKWWWRQLNLDGKGSGHQVLVAAFPRSNSIYWFSLGTRHGCSKRIPKIGWTVLAAENFAMSQGQVLKTSNSFTSLYKSNMDLQTFSIKLSKPDLQIISPPPLALRSLPCAFSWCCGRQAFPVESGEEGRGSPGLRYLIPWKFWVLSFVIFGNQGVVKTPWIRNQLQIHMLYSSVMVFLDHRVFFGWNLFFYHAM